jgi:hypothetical protein
MPRHSRFAAVAAIALLATAPAFANPSPSPAPAPQPAASPPPTTSTSSTSTTSSTTSVTAIGEASRDAADGLQGTDWMNRGIPGLFNGGKNGKSCDAASIDRACAINKRLEEMQKKGQLDGYEITVGARNGYKLFGNSLHTDTVVQIKDRNGKPLQTYIIDNYVGRSITGTTMTTMPADKVDFDPINGNSTAVKTFKPRPVASPSPTPSPSPAAPSRHK